MSRQGSDGHGKLRNHCAARPWWLIPYAAQQHPVPAGNDGPKGATENPDPRLRHNRKNLHQSRRPDAGLLFDTWRQPRTEKRPPGVPAPD